MSNFTVFMHWLSCVRVCCPRLWVTPSYFWCPHNSFWYGHNCRIPSHSEWLIASHYASFSVATSAILSPGDLPMQLKQPHLSLFFLLNSKPPILTVTISPLSGEGLLVALASCCSGGTVWPWAIWRPLLLLSMACDEARYWQKKLNQGRPQPLWDIPYTGARGSGLSTPPLPP